MVARHPMVAVAVNTVSHLELHNPSFECGHCRFETALTGTWTVEDGRLVFRGDPDPQPRRGPDLQSCCESSQVAVFDRIITDNDTAISGPPFEELQAAARESYQ